MSDTVIAAEELSKSYLVGHQSARRREQYLALRDVIALEARNFGRKAAEVFRGSQIVQGDEIEEFWALRDVSFQVKRGDVLGIIGRNGAGKSTLLKILSRITEPTRGRAVLRGRVASLLEVGTGFHAELTGRENIFLNGAILGMTKVEIGAKFDEIVAFAGIERFLDTPVKRYSSGMYVRLAFSIAAHLEPEILIVDEVLAVGDAEFQKKSLGKMRSVASEGERTVLFVSHNLQAIQSLCDRAILLDSGRVVMQGDPGAVVSRYFGEAQASSREVVWSPDAAPRRENVALMAVRVSSSEGEGVGRLGSDHDIHVDLEFESRGNTAELCVGFDLMDADGATIFRTYQTDLPQHCWPRVSDGRNRWRCKIPAGLLNGGDFYVSPRISIHNVSWIVHEDAVLHFHLDLRHGVSPLWSALNEKSRPGQVAPILEWTTIE